MPLRRVGLDRRGGLAFLGGGAPVAPPIVLPTVLRARTLFGTKDSNPPVIRYAETGRTKLVVRNNDAQGRTVGVAYHAEGNGSGNQPATAAYNTIPAGSEWVDTSGDARRLFCRTTPSQATTGNVTVEVYAEVAL